MIKQESDYFAIRSGSEPLCDICIGEASHSHARGVLAVFSSLAQQDALESYGEINEPKQLLVWLMFFLFLYF